MRVLSILLLQNFTILAPKHHVRLTRNSIGRIFPAPWNCSNRLENLLDKGKLQVQPDREGDTRKFTEQRNGYCEMQHAEDTASGRQGNDR
jgi:hypothetical protein